jgi:hypothetical protein
MSEKALLFLDGLFCFLWIFYIGIGTYNAIFNAKNPGYFRHPVPNRQKMSASGFHSKSKEKI